MNFEFSIIFGNFFNLLSTWTRFYLSAYKILLGKLMSSNCSIVRLFRFEFPLLLCVSVVSALVVGSLFVCLPRSLAAFQVRISKLCFCDARLYEFASLNFVIV